MLSINHKFKPLTIPTSPGVYLMRDTTGKIIYIGKAKNLKHRVSSYFKSANNVKTSAITSSLRHIDYILAASEREALILERQLISEYKPYFNVMWLDDKSYPYFKLTLKEDFPRLILTRKIVKDGSEYFGPYPQVSYIKKLMRWLQKVFKWRPCRLDFNIKSLPEESKVKSCLYFHTERCDGPCMGKISSDEYRKAMDELRLFLKGRLSELKHKLEREMELASENMQYERAANVRDRLKAISSMEEKVTVRELKAEELNASIKITQSLEELKKAINLEKWPTIIEGFDISNISGTESVGSMVRFHNGVPDKNNYRRFKIKTVQGIDDTAMIREVVFRRYRRLKAENRELPVLILIDGGKGQLSSALESLKALKLKIPIASIAKKEEEVFVPGKTEPVKLPANSKALHLLQNVRDEAHRFAVKYHRTRRKIKLGINLSSQYS